MLRPSSSIRWIPATLTTTAGGVRSFGSAPPPPPVPAPCSPLRRRRPSRGRRGRGRSAPSCRPAGSCRRRRTRRPRRRRDRRRRPCGRSRSRPGRGSRSPGSCPAASVTRRRRRRRSQRRHAVPPASLGRRRSCWSGWARAGSCRRPGRGRGGCSGRCRCRRRRRSGRRGRRRRCSFWSPLRVVAQLSTLVEYAVAVDVVRLRVRGRGRRRHASTADDEQRHSPAPHASSNGKPRAGPPQGGPAPSPVLAAARCQQREARARVTQLPVDAAGHELDRHPLPAAARAGGGTRPGLTRSVTVDRRSAPLANHFWRQRRPAVAAIERQLAAALAAGGLGAAHRHPHVALLAHAQRSRCRSSARPAVSPAAASPAVPTAAACGSTAPGPVYRKMYRP